MDTGRDNRLKRIFSASDNHALCIACDHGLMMDPYRSWLKISDVVESAVQAQADGLLLGSGQASRFVSQYGKGSLPACIIRTDWTNLLRLDRNAANHSALLPINQLEYRRLLSAKEVLYRYSGAAAIGFLLVDAERKIESLTLKACTDLVRECHAIGLPCIIEVLVLASDSIDKSPIDLLWRGVWLSLEIGADALKIPLFDEMPILCSAIHQAGKRLFVLGGSNLSDEALFLQSMQQAIDAGVDGLLVGRNVAKSDDPAGLIHKLGMIVHPGLDLSKQAVGN